MRLLFTVQGEGRGHLTQALAVYRSLSRQGHELVGVVVGSPGHRPLPDFFTSALPVEVRSLPSPGFVVRSHRSLSLSATLGRALLGLGSTRDSVRTLRQLCHDLRPDLIVNFFEPLTGLAQLFAPLPAPVVSIAHQFMFEHPGYRWPKGLGANKLGLKWFVGLVGYGSWKLALSLAPDEDLEAQRLVVAPPLLREMLFEQVPRDDGYYLVYLLNHGYADDIREWQSRHPDVSLQCFYDRPGAPEEERVAPGLTFHRLDGEKFLRLMAGCRAVVCTAGFESVSEALWLGKPLFLVPVEHHVEQALNAVEAERLGLGIADRSFALDRLTELPAEVQSEPFRRWVATAEACLDRVIGLALAEHRLREGASAAA
ncbi:MAG: glycosyltransferase family protein [Gemmatimonadales bacterium]